METHALPVGEQLRAWRARRRLSQLDLALDSEISARHLSFVETGRSRPNRDIVVRLTERLAVPARERNRILVAAGFAPWRPERRSEARRGGDGRVKTGKTGVGLWP